MASMEYAHQNSTRAAGAVMYLVCAVSDKVVLHRELLASPDVSGPQAGFESVRLVHGAHSAAQAFNPVMQHLSRDEGAGDQAPAESEVPPVRVRPGPAWVVWVHQDVQLPAGWLRQFGDALGQAVQRWPTLAVAGVYGLSGDGEAAVRAGEVWDRDVHLHEPTALPCKASSLDELLVAVRADCGLRMDPALGFDFYATDLCLQAQAMGLTSAVLHAPVRHASGTPRQGAAPRRVLERIARSAAVFERKWANRLPVFTPCFEIRQPGDVQAFIAKHFHALDGGHA